MEMPVYLHSVHLLSWAFWEIPRPITELENKVHGKQECCQDPYAGRLTAQ